MTNMQTKLDKAASTQVASNVVAKDEAHKRDKRQVILPMYDYPFIDPFFFPYDYYGYDYLYGYPGFGMGMGMGMGLYGGFGGMGGLYY